MALTDSAVLVPGVGHIFTTPFTSGATWTSAELATYASAGTVPTGVTWSELGHTDLDSILTFSQEGGDTTTKGSWQNPSLRTVITTAAVDSFTLNAEQVLDNDVLELYYGGGDASVADRFALPDAPAAIERSVMVVMLDGTTPLGFSVQRASILRGDVISLADDDFMKLPLKFTVLKASGQPRAEWINAALGV
jgi:hypothetical protein